MIILRIIIIIILAISLIVITHLFPNFNKKDDHQIVLEDFKELSIIVADTVDSRIKGLSGRDRLEDNEAMLFTFDTAERHGIWMKDMKFSIDIVWIDQNNQIVSIEEDVAPNTYPKVFYPTEKSALVLEANAGFVKRNNLKVGNFLNFNQK